MKVYVAGFALLLAATSGCRSTSPGRAAVKNEPVSRAASNSVVAESVLDFDVAKLKSHLANAREPDLKDKVLWSMFLEEPKADTPCPGKALEAYYFIDANSDGSDDTVYVLEGKPMPMNGPCGLAFDMQKKRSAEVGGALMESSPLGEIGTLDKVKLSVRDAVKKAESHYKTFKYRDGVKVYRHLHPETWDFPWYAVYGSACGADATVYVNAQTGEVREGADSPQVGPCQ